MMKHSLCLSTLFAMIGVLPAWSADTDPAPPSLAWAQVMQAQYAARQAALPIGPEEARRIYDAYLRTIGQAAKDHSTDSGSSGAGVTSR